MLRSAGSSRDEFMTYIMVEGADGSGKTTITKKLVKKLNDEGYKAVLASEPSTENVVGAFIRSLLEGIRPKDSELLRPVIPQLEGHVGRLLSMLAGGARPGKLAFQEIFTAEREEHMAQLMPVIVNSNIVLVSDRGYPSSIAYVESHGFSRDHVELIKRMNAIYPKPAILFVLDVDPKIALARTEKRDGGREYFDNLELQERVRESYQRNFPDAEFIDASKPLSDVLGEVYGKTMALLRKPATAAGKR